MLDRRYRRGGEPPPSGPRFKIIRVKAREHFNLSILGSTIHPFWCHWDGRRTQPCTEPQSECIGCIAKWSTRWKAYLHVLREDTGQEGFLECTSHNRDRLVEITGGSAFLRGTRVKVLRGNGDKTALTIMLLKPWAAEKPDEIMPEEKDPEDTLRALFTFASRNGGGRKSAS